ncbi:MAG: hypothetical protein V1802_02420 [Candidatus Aenigmatarchaeota archaeon]
MNSNKGDANIMLALVGIIFIIFMLIIVLSSAFGENIKRHKMIFDEVGIMKAKNTFVLLNRSLTETWRISSAQAIYNTGDESIGCGADGDLAKGDLVYGYWYQYNPASEKTPSCADKNPDGTNDCKLNDDGTNRYPYPRLSDEKYNYAGYNPRICFPHATHLVSYLDEKFKPYKNISKEFEANSANVKISNINNKFILTENNKLVNDVTQDISIELGKTTIKSSPEYKIIFGPEVSDILYGGWMATQLFLSFSDSITDDKNFYNDERTKDPAYNYGLRYQSIYDDNPDTKDSYEKRIKDEIINKSILLEKTPQAKFSIDFNDFELIAHNESYKILSSVTPPSGTTYKTGLILHYDATVRITGEKGIEAANCIEPSDDTKSTLDEKVNGVDNAWQFGDKKYTNEEIVQLVEAIMQVKDGRFNMDSNRESSNIKAAIEYIHDLFDKLKNDANNEENMIKFVIAAYDSNCGEDCVNNARDIARDAGKTDIWNYNEISSFLPAETQNYVAKVLGNYICYGGFVSSSANYYFNEEKNKFYKKPFSLVFKVEDYLPAIDCNMPATYFSYITENRNDLLCCDGVFYSCNVEGLGGNNIPVGNSADCIDGQFQCNDNGFA